MSERARLTDLIESVYCDATGMRLATSVAQRLAVEIASDGYRRIPTEGPEWDAMVERAIMANLNPLAEPSETERRLMAASLRAALSIER